MQVFLFFCYQFFLIPVRFCRQESLFITNNPQESKAITSLSWPASELFGVNPKKNSYFWALHHVYDTRISVNVPWKSQTLSCSQVIFIHDRVWAPLLFGDEFKREANMPIHLHKPILLKNNLSICSNHNTSMLL